MKTYRRFLKRRPAAAYRHCPRHRKRAAPAALDEPLGALDLKLRQDMQHELIRLKMSLASTFIYVTHDQGGGTDHV